MIMLWVKMTVVNITIEILFILFNKQFKLDINPIHDEVMCRICDSVEYAIRNMSVCPSFGEIKLRLFIFVWSDNHVHFLNCRIYYNS